MGWMTCTWAEQGRVETLEVRFNTVSDSFFWEIQRWPCAAAAPSRLPPPERHLDQIKALPYRFQNLIPRRLLLPDEVIEAIIFQEAIWRRRLWLCKRRITPSRIVLLTNAHILVASDEEVAGRGASHGMIARYFPRRHVRAVTVTPADLGLHLTVTVACVAAETTYTLLLAQHRSDQIDSFLQKFGSLDNKATETMPVAH